MRIEFDPTNPTEAAAVRAMLTAMQPQEERRFAAWINEKLNDVDMSTDGPSDDPDELERVEAEVKELLAAPELNAEGEPHDPRIHSTPPKLNADGTWRAKRGVTADQIAAVRAEREAQAVIDGAGVDGHAPAPVGEIAAAFEEPVTAPPAPPVTTAPPAPAGQSEAPLAPSASAESTASEAPSPPAIVTASTSGSATSASPSNPSFLDVMKAITAAQKDGKIDTAKVKELCAAVGAGESTMGLNGPDNGDKRVAFMALLAEETK